MTDQDQVQTQDVQHEEPNIGGDSGCVDGALDGKAVIYTTKKTCWEKIIDFFKKLFGIS